MVASRGITLTILSDSQILLAKHFIEQSIKPTILEQLEKDLKLKKNRIDIEPTFFGLDWELTIRKNFILDNSGEREEPFTEQIIAGDITFQVIFIPENYAPETGRIKIKWEDGIVVYDIDFIKTVMEKFTCPICSFIKGYSCKCVPRIKEIKIGEAKRTLKDICDDAVSALIHLQITKAKARDIVEKVKATHPHIMTFDKFIQECFKNLTKT